MMKDRLCNALPHRDTPFFRALHISVAVLVLLHIINSYFTESEALGDVNLAGFMTWFHVISGFTLIALGIVMLIWMLTQRGFHYYFAWLTLDFRGMAADLKTLIALRLPDAHAGGVAAFIQGLGVLALLGVALCGGLWFVLNTAFGPSSALAHDVLGLHRFRLISGPTEPWDYCIFSSKSAVKGITR